MTLSADWLRDRIADYFDAHNVETPVIYGTEKDAQNADTLTRVVVGLVSGPGSFKLIPAGQPGAPGHNRIADGVSARPFATKRQKIWISIRAAADPTVVVDRVRVSQTLTSDLMDEVLRAIHRYTHGSHGFAIDADGEWVDADVADAMYGAMVKLKGWIDIPVFDRSRGRVGLAKPSAPDPTKVDIGLELEVCNADGCEPVVSSP